MKPTIVTAALPYANGPVHIGHLAGAYLPSDIYVRFLRMMDEDVIYICGSDEHGVPITLRARKEGITPQQVVDKYHSIIKKSFADIGISFDIYHRTSEKIHHETAADFFKVIYDKGIFTEAETEQYYDEEAKKRRRLFLPTDTSQELVRTAEIQMHMVINARSAERVYRPTI
jgi:methionyl-tRNA synthetase